MEIINSEVIFLGLRVNVISGGIYTYHSMIFIMLRVPYCCPPGLVGRSIFKIKSSIQSFEFFIYHLKIFAINFANFEVGFLLDFLI